MRGRGVGTLYRRRELVVDRRRGRVLVMLKRAWGRNTAGQDSGEAIVKAGYAQDIHDIQKGSR